MRGMIDGQWYDLEEYEDHVRYTGRVAYTIKDDPERGCFELEDLEELA